MVENQSRRAAVGEQEPAVMHGSRVARTVAAGILALAAMDLLVNLLPPGPDWVVKGAIPVLVFLASLAVWLVISRVSMEEYVAALLATSPLLPGLAGVMAVIAYISWQNPLAYLVGTVAAFLMWISLCAIYPRFVTADHVNAHTYDELCGRVMRLQSQLSSPGEGKILGEDPIRQMAWKEANEYCSALERKLCKCEAEFRGMFWILGSGYINCWNLLHRAEEALIDFEPQEAVISGAIFDELRLTGVGMSNQGALLAKLRTAVGQLSEPATMYLGETARTQSDSRTGTPKYLENMEAEKEAQARAVLRGIRHTINEFRDNGRGGLIRVRNRLVKTVMFTGITLYLLLGLAMLMRVDRGSIAAAMAFYLVGAIVGLFAVLRSEARADHAVEDYGLVTARLIHTPLLSGIAAVAGVVLVLTLARQADGRNIALAADVFNVSKSPYALIIAAVFGLTPGLLIDRLRQQTDKIKEDLKATKATENSQK